MSQYAWLWFSWNLPVGHTAHDSAFAVLLNWPVAQAEHLEGSSRFESRSYLPGTQGCFRSQYACPARTWYFPTGQSLHSGSLAELEYLAPGQATQRSGVDSAVLDSYCPGMHAIFESQYG
jgi:hypothetical protein